MGFVKIPCFSRGRLADTGRSYISTWSEIIRVDRIRSVSGDFNWGVEGCDETTNITTIIIDDDRQIETMLPIDQIFNLMEEATR